jgi:hypothetical protein
MTNNNLLYMEQEEILDEYYRRILLIDNDMYSSSNIEEDRTQFINKVIDILEEYPDLCTSNSGDGFLRTILYPIMRMN